MYAMDNVPEATIVRHGILRSYLRSVLAILFLLVMMMIIMVLPVNSTLKMSFAGSLLFLIVYGIACVVQANLAGLVIQSSGPAHTDDVTSRLRDDRPATHRPRSPRPPPRLAPGTTNSVASRTNSPSPSRTGQPARHGHRHHHHHHHHQPRSRSPLEDPPPSYDKIDFCYQPEYLKPSDNPFCDPPPYPITPPEDEDKQTGLKTSSV